MDSIQRYALVKCPVCAVPHDEHPTDPSSTCRRYRPADSTPAESTEVARQAGLTVADLSGSDRAGIAMGGRSFLPATDTHFVSGITVDISGSRAPLLPTVTFSGNNTIHKPAKPA